MKVLLIFLVVLGSCVFAAEGRERPYESAKRWGSSVTNEVRLSCLNNGYANEITCRCAWNAGLVPASIGGTSPGCTEEFACNRLGGTNCNACGDSSENELTCRGLISTRDLERAYSIIVIILFGLLLTAGFWARIWSKRHSLRESAIPIGTDIKTFARNNMASPEDIAFMRTITKWQWTFLPLFSIPCIVILAALASIMGADFWDHPVQMPRWDHHTHSVQMPDGDWEEDLAFPALSNLPELNIQLTTQDGWIFDKDRPEFFYFTSEFFFLFFILAAVCLFPAFHTLVAYCRVVAKSNPGTFWPTLYYVSAIFLLVGIIGIANIQGAYGGPQTSAHFALSVIFFVFSFLVEFLVIVTVSSMNQLWRSRFSYARITAAMAIVFRTAYVIMYFISDAYPDNHNSHLFIYSTQNFLTWLFTFFQLWTVQSFPFAHADEPQNDKLNIYQASREAVLPPSQTHIDFYYPPQPRAITYIPQTAPHPIPQLEPIHATVQLGPVFIPNGTFACTPRDLYVAPTYEDRVLATHAPLDHVARAAYTEIDSGPPNPENETFAPRDLYVAPGTARSPGGSLYFLPGEGQYPQYPASEPEDLRPPTHNIDLKSLDLTDEVVQFEC